MADSAICFKRVDYSLDNLLHYFDFLKQRRSLIADLVRQGFELLSSGIGDVSGVSFPLAHAASDMLVVKEDV